MAGQAPARSAGCSGDEAGKKRAPFVSVAIRVKPSVGEDPVAIWAKPGEGTGQGCRRVCCHRGYLLEEYEFSRVFSPEDDNCQLFRDLQGPAVTASVFSGVNETLFAYGQTGSGKTHTIFGTAEEPGLLQLFVQAIFDQAEVSPGSTVHACCYEVLGDSLTDLASPQALIEEGHLQPEDVVWDELFIKTQKCRYQIVRVGCVETCLCLLQDARVNRTSGVSSCNSSSSRSHAVVHLFVQNPAAGLATFAGHGGAVSSSIGALTLVDLAGTEKEHENPSEQGRKSARLLNTSLSSLNRLLRKLQTGSLDESERRQSVLNKCLWEYLRPGCGIALIFCVSPLLRHRAITLSTLAMATDSKLINSQRKSQFIQIPATLPGQEVAFGSQPRQRSGQHQPPTASPPGRQGAAWPYTPSPVPKMPVTGERTPRRASSAERTARGRTPDFCSTPRMVQPPGPSPFFPAAMDPEQAKLGYDVPREPLPPEELERMCGYDLRSPVAVRSLALTNTKLRRKLSRARARSQERVEQVQREREQLTSENVALQRECESLRVLFIRQQQQQIAFWTGPFMEMIAPKDASAVGLTASAGSRVGAGSGTEPADAAAPVDAAPPALPPGPPLPPAAAAGQQRELVQMPSAKNADAEEARSECLRTLRRERDHWRLVAADLKREMRSSPRLHGSQKGSRQESELSTSHSRQDGSDGPSHTPWSGSESCSEPSSRA